MVMKIGGKWKTSDCAFFCLPCGYVEYTVASIGIKCYCLCCDRKKKNKLSIMLCMLLLVSPWKMNFAQVCMGVGWAQNCTTTVSVLQWKIYKQEENYMWRVKTMRCLGLLTHYTVVMQLNMQGYNSLETNNKARRYDLYCWLGVFLRCVDYIWKWFDQVD